MEFFDIISSVFASTIRMSAPLIFASLGGVSSERAGIVNIALEGKMLVGAFAAASVTYYTSSPMLGFLSGGLAGMILSIIFGIFVINLRANQIVVGIAITILAMGAVPIISQLIFQNSGSTPEIPIGNRFYFLPIFLSWFCAILLWFVYKYTPFGLWTKFSGEHPEALQVSGVKVLKVRWASVLLSGFLAGFGGATLSICLSSNYTRNMVAGRGYMALAALIVGNWNPIYSMMSCFLFGFFDAIGIILQSIKITFPIFDPTSIPLGKFIFPILKTIIDFLVSPQFIQIVPYLLTIIIVAGFVGKTHPPKTLGKPLIMNR